MLTRLTTLTAAFAATLALLTPPSNAADPAPATQQSHSRAGVGYGIEIADGTRANRSANDIWQVSLYSANSGEPAAIAVHFNDVVPYEGETRVYLNFDRDTKPEAAIAMGGNHYRLYKVRGWRDHGTDAYDCGRVDSNLNRVDISFGPSCLGGRKNGTMALSVVSTYPGARTEFVPGGPGARKQWSRKVRTYQPN